MIVEDQKVKIKWNGRNKQHFIEKGYIFTNLNDEFEVNPMHLTKGSPTLVKVVCDFCGKEKEILFNQFFDQVIKHELDKYCCKDCGGKRISEKHENELVGFKLHKHCDTKTFKGVIYETTENIYKLNSLQKILINEIQRFCEENKRFPNEKEMNNKNGYISRTQYYKYFNTKAFTDIYKYIYPLQKCTLNKNISEIQKQISKPIIYRCSKCNIEKEFTNEYFSENKAGKYGLRTMCRECENNYAILLSYKKRGIYFKEFTDISPEKWWEYLNQGLIGYLPDFCLEEQNVIKIVRHVFLNVLKLNKEEICNINLHKLKDYNIYHLYARYYEKLKFLNLCFPELKINVYDLAKSRNATDEDKIEFIYNWINSNKYTLTDLLEGNYDSMQLKMKNFVTVNFSGYIDMLIWYFNKVGIKHPNSIDKITVHDFKYKPEHYWDNEENRINCIRKYCYENGISDVLYDIKLLKKWVFNHFRQNMISKLFNYHIYYKGLYEVLVTAFPEIINNKTLFEWEWHQCNTNDKDFLIKSLREMILYREHKYNPSDISRFLNHTTLIENGYAKFTKHVQRGKFSNYYEWACLSFPEYKDDFRYDDFYKFVTKDGSICDSFEEVKLYEYIKYDLNIKDIKAIGTSFKGDHIFKLPRNNKDNWYCPDFLINNSIFIEYFGLYTNNPPKDNKLLVSYKNKTQRKIKYYNSQPFTFIYLFPEDLRDSFEGVKRKLKNLNLVI